MFMATMKRNSDYLILNKTVSFTTLSRNPNILENTPSTIIPQLVILNELLKINEKAKLQFDASYGMKWDNEITQGTTIA